VQTAESVRQTKAALQQQQIQLLILDADLSNRAGLQLCQWVYQHFEVMILLLSTRNSESDIVAGLQAGADDYLAKPLSMQVLQARIDALSRRLGRTVPPSYLHYGDLKIDLVQRRVTVADQGVDLTPQEFSLLFVLAQAGGRPLSRTELLQRAWPDEIDNPRTVDTHILTLRKKLEIDPRQPHLIQTVRNVGYCFSVSSAAG
jgi:two-component system OmpR family response regulator